MCAKAPQQLHWNCKMLFDGLTMASIILDFLYFFKSLVLILGGKPVHSLQNTMLRFCVIILCLSEKKDIFSLSTPSCSMVPCHILNIKLRFSGYTLSQKIEWYVKMVSLNGRDDIPAWTWQWALKMTCILGLPNPL